jgi:crotonobetainyl-CoA:carnitine CoA-transferase CaiB-like acyl-CoA transferase
MPTSPPSRTDRLLDGVRVVDLCGEPGAMAGRILADLGAEVVRLLPIGEDGVQPVRTLGGHDAWRALAWTAGTEFEYANDDLAGRLAGAHVVLDTPGWPDTHQLDPAVATDAVWVSITPFGREGPRAAWRATDLGIMAASGNLWCTGDPDRPPVRCTEPIAYAHTGPEAAYAALTALASGQAQRVDLSMQETVLIADMGGPGRFSREGDRGRRRGANIGRTREIWPCADGWVSFGIRGGKARVATWATVTRLAAADGIDVSALEGRDWSAFNHNNADLADLEAISAVVEGWFARHTMTDLYAYACEHNLTLAPINSPREILASEQFTSRGFFGPVGEVPRFPRSFVQVRAHDHDMEAVGPPLSLPTSLPAGSVPVTIGRTAGGEAPPAPPATAAAPPRPAAVADFGPGGSPGSGAAWSGTTIVELGSGAAGPIATRYFAEHGATVIRVESRSRPDFLRVYALGPKNPHGLDGAPMFDSLNPGKLGITLDLKNPEGKELALRLIDRADAVAENFAPKAMAGLGLDYDHLVERRPDLVMISACLNGQTGPHRDYPGFGGQGAALAGFNFLTGWPDREPIGPYGTITDSLAPRFAAAALAAALLYRRRTGQGCYLDLSQVEAGSWSLSPWLLRYETGGKLVERRGNRHEWAVPHGVFPSSGDDRWIAIAVWNDADWAPLGELLGADPALARSGERQRRVDEVEQLVGDWTRQRDAAAAAEQLQAVGIEAVPVADFGDCFADPQLAARGHFEELSHPLLGAGHYERNGFRLSESGSGYGRPSPLLGEHTRQVLADVLGLDDAEIDRLADAGALD